MRKETNGVVSNFLGALGSKDIDQSKTLESVLKQLCAELNRCLIKIKSLPPSPPTVILELSILYNLLYASTVKAWLCQHRPLRVTSSVASTVELSLRRVQQMLGGANHTSENDYLQRDNTQAEQVSAALSSFLNMLHAVDDKDIQQSVGLLTCMWSLAVLLESGSLSSLPCLSSVLNWPSQESEVVLKHGLLMQESPPSPAWKIRENLREKTAGNGIVQNFSRLLIAVSFFHKQNWTECRDHASKVDHPKWKSLATLLTARALLDGGSCLEAVGVLHTALSGDTDAVNPAVVCHIYRLLASCYSAQNLPRLAVEMLRRCLQMEPGSTASLVMLAKQFQTLAQGDAELECLKALVKAADKTVVEETSNTMLPPLLDDLLVDVIVPHDDLTLSQALYCLATRSAELKKYEESSQAYMKLIQVFEKKVSAQLRQQPSEIVLPDLLTVCREAAQVLLRIPQYKQCLRLCDRVLSAVSSTTCPSNPSSDSVFPVFSSPEQKGTQPDESFTVSQADLSAEEKHLVFKFKSGRKRCLSSAGEGGFCAERKEEIVWKDEENRTLLMVCKAECLVAIEDHEAAVKVLTRAFMGLVECWQKVEGQRSGEAESDSTWERPLTSNPKRPRYSLGQGMGTDIEEPAAEEEQTEGNEEWRQLSTQVCLYLADAYCRCGQQQQALHSARLATQMKPENEVSQFYLTSILNQLGRGRDGCQTWLVLRGLPHNTGSVRLQSAIQQRQDMMRSAAAESGSGEKKRLGTVTDKEKLQLDLACLQLLLNTRTKR
ncbi:hypothetical protein V1264_015628 [Littorina saxatilis]